MSTPPLPSFPHLTVAILAHNAELTLPATLASVKRLASEVLVVDTASTDGTVQVAESFQAKIITGGDAMDHAAAKNLALHQATGKWILWIEPGETLPLTTISRLPMFLQSEANVEQAYLLTVQVPPAAGHASGEQALQVRLIPNKPQLTFVGRVHETLYQSIQDLGLKLVALEMAIDRGVQEHAPEHSAQRALREYQLAELQLADRGPQGEALLVKATALAVLKRHAEAIATFQQALPHSDRGSTTMLEIYYGLLTAYDMVPECEDEQVNTCLQALEVFPLDAQLLCAMGGYMLRQNRLDLAIRSYAIAVGHGHVDPLSWHLADIGQVTAASLCLAQQLAGKDEDAQSTLEEAIQRFPTSTRLRRHLLTLHIKHGQADEALAQVDHLVETPTASEAFRSAVRGAVLGVQKNWSGALPYLQTAYAANCRDPICLRWLAVAYLSTGKIDAAVPILQQWQALEPANTEIDTYFKAVAEISPQTSPEILEPSRSSQSGPKPKLRVDEGQSVPHGEPLAGEVRSPRIIGPLSTHDPTAPL